MLAREPRVQPPALEAYSDVPLFNTKAVVHQTGVPAPTLRAWERRYGILAPRRGENDYRLYSERDIATVTWLRERVEGGMTISQAIALLRSLEPARRSRRRATQPPAPAAPAAEQPTRLALDTLTTALLQHIKALDEQAARRVMIQAVAVHTIEDVCLQLFTPVLYDIGRQWAAGEICVTVEHFAVALVRAQLENLYQIAAGTQTGPLVLVGCAPGEQHELGSLMLALFLRRAGLRVAYLGQNLEQQGLILTARAAHPAALILSATMPDHAARLVEMAEALRVHVKPCPALYCGGQGFAADPALAARVSGEYLTLNALDAAQEIRKRVSA
jgi:DNA-binding transcriptional MerR regulator/methylmalonyl-CoA mutase cobalamin-binding subunit